LYAQKKVTKENGTLVRRPSGSLRYSEISGRCGTHKIKIINFYFAQTVLAASRRYFLPLLGDSQGEFGCSVDSLVGCPVKVKLCQYWGFILKNLNV
tara:strand:- start:13833 stop:14120 length:288 start_codon:yes stop_codon:yes gene_type:complete